ncbi:hypothetical protein JCM10207_005612 [Rhodosporidiobolus poonsookiae]
MTAPTPGHAASPPPLSAPTSHSHALDPSPSPLQTAAPLQPQAVAVRGNQRAFVVPAVPRDSRDELVDSSLRPSLDLSATPHNVADTPVRLSGGIRPPSYGALAGSDGAPSRGSAAPKDPLRRNGGGVEGTERLAKRPRTRERRSDGWEPHSNYRRQFPYAEGYPDCSYVDNSVLSCYPETNTTLVQDEYSLFIWNSRYPTFIGAGAVDVYLYNANTQAIAASWTNLTNAAGMMSIQPEDLWWADPAQTTSEWFGSAAGNRTQPYFFVVVDAGTTLDGGESHQATFDVVQTAAPTSLSSSLAALTSSSLSSISSASASSASLASSLSAASVSSSLSGASATSSSRSGGRDRSGDLQNGGSSSPFPRWAIAVIVVLGVLALVAGALAVYFCLGRARRRRREDDAARQRGSVATFDDDVTNGSSDPILGAGARARGSTVNSANLASPSSAGFGSGVGVGAAAGAGALGALAAGGTHDPEKHDEATTLSHTDAARMAEAFRAALRRPEFVPGEGSPEGDSPSDERPASAAAGAGPGAGPSPTGRPGGDESGGSGERNEAGRALVEDELRSEGKSMKSVGGGRWGRSGGV